MATESTKKHKRVEQWGGEEWSGGIRPKLQESLCYFVLSLANPIAQICPTALEAGKTGLLS